MSSTFESESFFLSDRFSFAKCQFSHEVEWMMHHFSFGTSLQATSRWPPKLCHQFSSVVPLWRSMIDYHYVIQLQGCNFDSATAPGKSRLGLISVHLGWHAMIRERLLLFASKFGAPRIQDQKVNCSKAAHRLFLGKSCFSNQMNERKGYQKRQIH